MITSHVTVSDLYNLANQALRSNVHRFTPPPAWSQSHSADFGEIWFPSIGCAWWENGSCNMCNYGASISPTPEQMIQAVALSLASFDSVPGVLWVSAFDNLDRRDVPVEVRHQIYRLLANSNAHTIISESYPSIVSFNKVKECVELLPGKQFVVEIGVESTNDLLRTWCIHKNFTNDHIQRAIIQTKQAGAEIYINLLVGIPFLTMDESIDDAVSSVKESFEAGADSVVIFPCHIKENTLYYWLYQHGIFQPPSLWVIVETILRSNPKYWSRIKLAWLETKNHPGSSASIKPTIDYENEEEFMSCLMEFNEIGDGEILRPLLNSSSYSKWRSDISLPAKDSTQNRIAQILPRIGIELLDGTWWAEHGEYILQLLMSDWDSQYLSVSTGGGSPLRPGNAA
jgi:radical SAM enzyme (TIGR01210 family)